MLKFQARLKSRRVKGKTVRSSKFYIYIDGKPYHVLVENKQDNHIICTNLPPHIKVLREELEDHGEDTKTT